MVARRPSSNPASAPILIYTLTSDTLTPAELYDAASTVLAQKLSHAFDGTLPISFSGGIDAFNIKDVLETGIQPVTVATLLVEVTDRLAGRTAELNAAGDRELARLGAVAGGTCAAGGQGSGTTGKLAQTGAGSTVWYLALWGLVLLVVGLIAVRVSRR